MKSPSRAHMESRLTELEMDAVLQLIQLSRNPAHDFQVLCVNFQARREGIKQEEDDDDREESVGETLSSTVINPAKSVEEALPRRRKKYLRIADIYRKTQPWIMNRTQKRSGI